MERWGVNLWSSGTAWDWGVKSDHHRPFPFNLFSLSCTQHNVSSTSNLITLAASYEV